MDAENFEDRVQREVREAVASSQKSLMDDISGLISSKFSTFEARFSENQRDLSENQLSKIQQNILSNENYQFKKKSCEDQFKFNAKVLGKLRDAEAHAESGVRQQDVKQDISEGIKLINNRQKLIRMADASELGWRFVDEYITNPLASDEEDEKRMNRAEARATKKVKQERQKKVEKAQKARRFAPYSRVPSASTVTSNPGAPIGTVVTTPRRAGVCFECGMANHWKFECPNRKIGAAKDKLSTFFIDYAQVNNSVSGQYQSSEQVNIKSGQSDSWSNNQGKNVNIDLLSNVSSKDENTQSPVGRLKGSANQWMVAGASRYILSVIQGGYRIPFKKLPESAVLRNNRSARDNPSFVGSEIQSLLDKRCIVEVSQKPWVVNPLTVAYNRHGKPRLVLDCRHINHLLCTYKFKYEDVSVVRQLFKTGDFTFVFDLKSAYHHISLFPSHMTYCGFSWTEKGMTKYYMFCVLPFGLSVSGFIFSKVMRVVIGYWRAQGLRVAMFLDDGIGGDKSYDEAFQVSKFVRTSLPKFGFLIAENKCCWEPAQVCTWLGYVWNFIEGQLYATEERICRLESSLNSLIFQLGYQQTNLIPVRYLACVVGQIISLQNAIGKVVRMKTRFLYKCMLHRASWNSLVPVDDDALGEITFWRDNARVLNDRGMRIELDNSCEIEAFSDASAVGYGGYLSLCAGALSEGTEVFGAWDDDEKSFSSTYRETEAVRRVLNSNIEVLQGKKVKWFSDNKNVKAILKSGSSKADLQEIALSIQQTCVEREITLIPEWIPRFENKFADGLSRGLDSDDWQVQRWVFDSLDKVWGNHTVDRFASNLNSHCTRFNSRFWCPGTEGVNAFDQRWADECNWVVPAPRDVLRALQKLESDRSRGTCVIPLWKTAPFWPILQPQGNAFASFVKGVRILPQYNVISQGLGNNGVFSQNPLPFRLLALRVDFTM